MREREMEGTLLREKEKIENRAFYGTVGKGDDYGSYPC